MQRCALFLSKSNMYACEHSAFLNIHTIFIILMIGRLVGSWPLRSNSKPHSNLCIAFDSLLKLWWGRIKPLEVVCSAGDGSSGLQISQGSTPAASISSRWSGRKESFEEVTVDEIYPFPNMICMLIVFIRVGSKN